MGLWGLWKTPCWNWRVEQRSGRKGFGRCLPEFRMRSFSAETGAVDWCWQFMMGAIELYICDIVDGRKGDKEACLRSSRQENIWNRSSSWVYRRCWPRSARSLCSISTHPWWAVWVRRRRRRSDWFPARPGCLAGCASLRLPDFRCRWRSWSGRSGKKMRRMSCGMRSCVRWCSGWSPLRWGSASAHIFLSGWAGRKRSGGMLPGISWSMPVRFRPRRCAIPPGVRCSAAVIWRCRAGWTSWCAGWMWCLTAFWSFLQGRFLWQVSWLRCREPAWAWRVRHWERRWRKPWRRCWCCMRYASGRRGWDLQVDGSSAPRRRICQMAYPLMVYLRKFRKRSAFSLNICIPRFALHCRWPLSIR